MAITNKMQMSKRNKIDTRKVITLERVSPQQIGWKPNGIWYSCYGGWLEWAADEMPDRLYKYIHEMNINRNTQTDILHPDTDKILVVRTIKDFDEFHKLYKSSSVPGLRRRRKGDIITDKNRINWKRVARDYGGIEICPFIKKRINHMWYNMWDVASGCVWNISIIKSFALVYEKVRGKYTKVK